MMRILVYISDLEKAQALCTVLSAYFQKVRHSYRISAYTKWDDAMKHVHTDAAKYDVVFLDSQDLQKAAALIKQFREYNQTASWVYIGPDLEGLCRILLMRPSAYLADLSDNRKTLVTIQRLNMYHQEMHKKNDFSFKFEGEIIRIPYTQISHFESSAKKVTLYVANSNRTYHFSAKLDDIEEMLPSFFLRCHQSYLVNLHMIRTLDNKNHVFLLHSAEEVFISRRSYVASKEAYENFLKAQQEYTPVAPR